MTVKLTPGQIKACRINLDYTQGKLARKSGVSTALIGAIERGDRILTDDVAARIRTALPLSDEDITVIMAARQFKRKGETE